MRLDTSQQMRTDMRLRMAPRMIQSMEILQLPIMALQERIDQELSENPVLVDLRESSTPEPENPERPRRFPRPPTPTPEETTEYDVPDDDWGETHRMSRAALSEEADRKHDAMPETWRRGPARFTTIFQTSLRFSMPIRPSVRWPNILFSTSMIMVTSTSS